MLEARNGATGAAAAAVDVAVMRRGAVHATAAIARGVLGDGDVGAVVMDPSVEMGRVGAVVTLVRDDEVGARGERVRHVTAERIVGRPRRLVTATAASLDVVEEAPRVLVFGREVEGEPGLGALEPAVHIAVAHRRVPPLVTIHLRAGEVRSIHDCLHRALGFKRGAAGDRRRGTRSAAPTTCRRSRRPCCRRARRRARLLHPLERRGRSRRPTSSSATRPTARRRARARARTRGTAAPARAWRVTKNTSTSRRRAPGAHLHAVGQLPERRRRTRRGRDHRHDARRS